MRIANHAGRLTIVTPRGGIDVETASNAVFCAAPQAIYDRWDEFVAWAAKTTFTDPTPITLSALGPPVPRPPQIIAVGLNYRDHAVESGLELPQEPMVFTKFASCLTGPHAEVTVVPQSWTDWEVELVVVIGRRAEHVPPALAWTYVAGLTVGQDISDRLLQFRDNAPQQFNLGKSLPGFGPIGPWVTTPDELSDPDDLMISCAIDGEIMQHASTRDMVFSVPQLIARLSALIPLLPGDLIFTGTPSGIGAGRRPPQFLRAGQTLTSCIDGIGEMHNRIVSSRSTS